MAKLYTSDLHYDHDHIIRFDGRPWFNVDEMREDLIQRWNNKVTDNDDVYIIGDFCWGTVAAWRNIVPRLKGRKHLTTGNHDPKLPKDVQAMFVEVVPYKELKDGGRKVILCHYPIIAYNHDSDPRVWMLSGHTHNTIEAKAFREALQTYKKMCQEHNFNYQGQIINCFCGFSNYAPATLDEWIANTRARY